MADEIKCHAHDGGFPFMGTGFKIEWERREDRRDGPYGYPFRQCTYCGAIHPGDMLAFLKDGVVNSFHDADWKYGWPHKFYFDVPNPFAGEPRRCGSMIKAVGEVPDEHDRKQYIDWVLVNGRWEGEMIMPAPDTTPAKFYATHLQDVDDDLLDEIARHIFARTGITFKKDSEGRLMYARGR